MRIRWMALTMAVAAGIATPLDHGLRAQEPESEEVRPALGERSAVVQQTNRVSVHTYRCFIDGEVQILRYGGTGDPCWPGFEVPFEGWQYTRDEVRVPPPSQAQVRAAWMASRVAEAEGRATITTDDAPVPPLGDGYGSTDLRSQTLVLRVRSDGPTKPRMYDGVPIVERDRIWERSVTSDGRRVWRSTNIVRQPSLGNVAARYNEGSRATLRSLSGQRGIRAQEGMGRPGLRTPPMARAVTSTPRRAPPPASKSRKSVVKE